jgi:hypothetical protein
MNKNTTQTISINLTVPKDVADFLRTKQRQMEKNKIRKSLGFSKYEAQLIGAAYEFGLKSGISQMKKLLKDF